MEILDKLKVEKFRILKDPELKGILGREWVNDVCNPFNEYSHCHYMYEGEPCSARSGGSSNNAWGWVSGRCVYQAANNLCVCTAW